MKYRTCQGVSLAYDDTGGEGAPLVFVHGLGCDHTDFAPQVAHFRGAHRVIAVDLRGHGQSDQPASDYAVPDLADDVACLCDGLGLAQPVVVGHSLGGQIAIELAARHPTLPTAIVALDAAIVPPARFAAALPPIAAGLRTPAYRDVLRGFFARAFAPLDDAERKDHILDRLAALPQGVLIPLWDGFAAWDGAAAAWACQVPALYVDHGTPNCDLDRLRALCPHLIDGKTVGAGHWAMLEVPGQVNAMIDRFLACIRNRGAAWQR